MQNISELKKHLHEFQGGTVVLATGVFDLFHEEHDHFLKEAKKIGDVLVVGVESDVRVKKLKGHHRPVQSQQQRLEQVRKCSAVDVSFVLPEKFDDADDHHSLLEIIKPQFLAVSSSSPHLVEKKRLMKSIGGEVVVVLEHNPVISTTQLLAKKHHT